MEQLRKLWDENRNRLLGYEFENISKGSNKTYCWICEKNHHTLQSMHNKSKGRGCAYCSNQKLLPGYNDLKTRKPDLADEWDYDLNYPFVPELFFSSEATVVWWKCKKCGNSFDTSINQRSKGEQCPFCSGKRVKKGFNDLATTNPSLVSEWDYEHNNLLPTQVSKGSNESVWWIDSYGHKWKAQINSRVRGTGCPYCAGQRVLPGFNDLKTKNENIASEWDYDKNDTLLPEMFTYSSTEKVWWKCAFCSNEWVASIDNRTRDRGCPRCSARRRTSFPEQAILFYLKQIFEDVRNSYKDIFDIPGLELDIYIPELACGIEYDGFFHRTNDSFERDERKYKLCKKQDIKLIRISTIEDERRKQICDYYIPCHYDTNNFDDLDDSINALLAELNVSVDINTNRDKNYIKAQYFTKLSEDSIVSRNPLVASEWDYKLNYPLTPETFSYGSGEYVWWKCSLCGKKWQSAIHSRTRQDVQGCPDCQLKRMQKSRCKKVKNLNTGEIFDSLIEASNSSGIHPDTISKVCRGKKESFKGIKWKFV